MNTIIASQRQQAVGAFRIKNIKKDRARLAMIGSALPSILQRRWPKRVTISKTTLRSVTGWKTINFLLNKDDRAALIAFGQDIEQAKVILGQTDSRSLQRIYHKNFVFLALRDEKTQNFLKFRLKHKRRSMLTILSRRSVLRRRASR
jgi:hypothetical protein